MKRGLQERVGNKRGRREGKISSVWAMMSSAPICYLLQVLEYNAVGGKYNRGLTVLQAYRELVEPRKQDAESLQRALTVGWCVELVRRWGEAEASQSWGFLLVFMFLCLYVLQSNLGNVNHFRH